MQPMGRAVAGILATVILATLGPGAALAQDWQEYAYPEAGFAAQFPSKPAVSDGSYRTAQGLAAAARIYAAHQGGVDYSVTVADLSKTGIGGSAAIDDAVKTFAGTGRIKLDVSERIDRQFGRELSVAGADGSQTATAIFFLDGKLYVLAGKAAAPDAEAGSPLTVRFQQSLQFIDKDGKPPRRPEDGPGFGRPGGGPPGEGGPQGPGRRRPPPQAFADCQGKTEGQAVQHQIPRGDLVAATCIRTPEGLAARPNMPLGGPPPEG